MGTFWTVSLYLGLVTLVVESTLRSTVLVLGTSTTTGLAISVSHLDDLVDILVSVDGDNHWSLDDLLDL
jgi:hypothetical protein